MFTASRFVSDSPGARCPVETQTTVRSLLAPHPLLGLLAAVGYAFLAPQVVAAQTRGVIDCEQCEMRATKLIELGEADGPGILGMPAHVVRRKNGEWVVGDYQGRGVIKVFAPDGTFSRSFGGYGQGPGEFQIPAQFQVLKDDGLDVVDYGALRITTLTPSLSYSRTRPMGPGGQSVALFPAGHVVAGILQSARSIGLPLHYVDAGGQVVRSFGADPPIANVANADAMWRGLAAGTDGEVWSAELLRYVVERWDTTGVRTLRLEREVSWFPPQSSYGYTADSRYPPHPGLPFIYADSRGRLWTVVHVPDPNWKAAFVEGKDPYGRSTMVVDDFNKYYDSIVEVIDPVRGHVVGHARLDQSVTGFAGEGLVVTRELRGDGYPVVVVWSLAPPNSP